MLEIETFVRNPAGIRSNGRLGNKGREKMKILEKLWSAKVNKGNCKCKNVSVSWNIETIAPCVSTWL